MSFTRAVPPSSRGRTVLLLFLLLGPLVLYGQKTGTWLRFAEEARAEGDHHEAVGYLRKALKGAPERPDIRYKLAHALRRSKLYEQAMKEYKKVQEADPRGERFPELLLHLAKMQERAQQYRQAKRSWGELKRRYVREKDDPLYKRAVQGSRSCEYAQENLERADTTEMEALAYPINTKGSEFAPYILKDSILFFTALRAEGENQDGTIEGPPPRSRILRSPAITEKSDEGGSVDHGRETAYRAAWGEPVPLGLAEDDDQHAANATFADDGRTILFSLCKEAKGEKRCRLARSRKKGNSWSEPETLPERIVPDSFNSTHPMIGKYRGDSVLFFSSDRPEGKGKMDIWYVPRRGVGEYGKVRNAGDSINSPGNEVTPYYLEVEEKLYFASDWHEGFGGFDLFSSKGKEDGFGRPFNLGSGVNSSQDELYPYIDEERNKGFMASNREEATEGWVGMCCNDLFEWPVSIEPRTDTVEEVTSVEDLNRFLPVTLYFHNDRPDPSTLDTTTKIPYDASYRDYKERVPNYIDTYAKGREKPLKDSARKRMKRFFDDEVDGGMQDLRLFSELLLRELKKGQDIELTIKGYASPLAKTEYNVHLTKRRIASLVNYLREYRDGAYIPYLEGEAENEGSLSFLYKPYGEYSADSAVSDELEDEQESVYSVSAALERKIEIERVKQVREDTSYPELAFEKGVLDLGRLERDSLYEETFTIRNDGRDTLRIDSVESEEKDLTVEMGKSTLPPGKEEELRILLKAGGDKGKRVARFKVHSNGISRKKEASVTYELPDQR